MAFLYFPELEASTSGSSSPCQPTAPSATSSGSPTALKSSRPGSEMDALTTPRSGTTCAPSTGDPGLDAWILSLAASRAKTSHAPGSVLASNVNALASGLRCSGSLAKFDHDSSSWRTCQASLLPGERWEPFSGAWPRAGMTCCGTAYRRRPAAPRTGGTGGGLWPTPRVAVLAGKAKATKTHGWDLPAAAKDSLEANPSRAWPTPCVADATGGRTTKGKDRPNECGLAKTVKMWTTPCADDTGHRKKQYPQGGTALSTQAGGQLNPTWVEWLMGFPLGWTDCEPLATESFQSWCSAFSKHFGAADE